MNRFGILFACSVLLFAALGEHKIERYRNQHADPKLSVVDLPRDLGPWKGKDAGEMDQIPREILQLSSYVRRTYTRDDGATVFVYIGYWAKQSGDYQAAKHSPELCLPANGWSTTQLGQTTLALSGQNLLAKRIHGTLNNNVSSIFYYWFFSGDKTYTDEWRALFYIAWESLFRNRSDGGIVEISSPLSTSNDETGEAAKIEENIENFIQYLQPALEDLTNSQKSPVQG